MHDPLTVDVRGIHGYTWRVHDDQHQRGRFQIVVVLSGTQANDSLNRSSMGKRGEMAVLVDCQVISLC